MDNWYDSLLQPSPLKPVESFTTDSATITPEPKVSIVEHPDVQRLIRQVVKLQLEIAKLEKSLIKSE